MTFKFNLDEIVFDKWGEEVAVIQQKRIEYGNQIYYRLDSGSIRHESQLYKMKKVETKLSQIA